MTETWNKRTSLGFLSCGVLLSAVFVLSVVSVNEGIPFILTEGGLIEIATLLGYFACIAQMLLLGGWAYVRKHYEFMTLLVFFVLRELDFHTRFTTMGVFKTKFYLSHQVPIIEKTVALIVVLLLTFVVIQMFKNKFRLFLSGLKEFHPISVAALLSSSFIFISQAVDGATPKLKGIIPALANHDFLNYVVPLEETLEFGIPLFLVFAFHIYFRDNRKSRVDP